MLSFSAVESTEKSLERPSPINLIGLNFDSALSGEPNLISSLNLVEIYNFLEVLYLSLSYTSYTTSFIIDSILLIFNFCKRSRLSCSIELKLK